MTNPDRPSSALVHASCVALGELGVLIIGRPGAGKSDLALRLIDQPGLGIHGIERRAALVADDQVVVDLDAGRLVARPPRTLAGLLEVRGCGILKLPYRPATFLSLVVALAPAASIERLPSNDADEMAFYDLLGCRLPLLMLDPGFASASARVRAAIDILSGCNPAVISSVAPIGSR